MGIYDKARNNDSNGNVMETTTTTSEMGYSDMVDNIDLQDGPPGMVFHIEDIREVDDLWQDPYDHHDIVARDIELEKETNDETGERELDPIRAEMMARFVRDTDKDFNYHLHACQTGMTSIDEVEGIAEWAGFTRRQAVALRNAAIDAAYGMGSGQVIEPVDEFPDPEPGLASQPIYQFVNKWDIREIRCANDWHTDSCDCTSGFKSGKVYIIDNELMNDLRAISQELRFHRLYLKEDEYVNESRDYVLVKMALTTKDKYIIDEGDFTRGEMLRMIYSIRKIYGFRKDYGQRFMCLELESESYFTEKLSGFVSMISELAKGTYRTVKERITAVFRKTVEKVTSIASVFSATVSRVLNSIFDGLVTKLCEIFDPAKLVSDALRSETWGLGVIVSTVFIG